MKNILYQLYLRMRFQKLRSRFLAAFVVLTIPPLFILGYISYNISKDTLLDSNTKAAQVHLRASSEAADLMFRNILNLNQSVILNENIRDQLMLVRNADSIQQNNIHSEIVKQLQKMVNSQFLNFKNVDSIILIDLNDQAHSLGRSDNLGVYEGANKREAIRQAGWYQDAVKAQGKVIFYPENVLGDSDTTFSTVKLFRHSGNITGEPVGILIVNLSKSIFDTILTSKDDSMGQYITLSQKEDGVHVVYPKRSSVDENKFRGNTKQIVAAFEKEGYLAIDYKNETTGWIFLYVIQIHELLKDSRKIGMFTGVLATGIAMVALLLSYIISGSITRPLLQLKKMMLNWTQGRREFEETFIRDEVGAIGQTFKKMASENEELSEKLVLTQLKEREAELRALQAQIKPHFLYNTLDSIYWMAMIKKNHEVAQMALSLSESFKLSLNKGKETIPIYKELQHIEHYMNIQNIRYNNRFKYIENVGSSIKTMEMLKLLLQPLVENAIYHGLEPKVGEGTVSLTGTKEGEYLIFVIEDDGVGIHDMKQTEKGYGLRNVRDRVKMFYGESSDLLISSKLNEGTRMELRIHLKGREVQLNV